MKTDAIRMFACPSCAGAVSSTRHLSDAGEVVDGELECTSCGRHFEIVGGIPSFVAAEEGGGHVATSFGFEWQTHHDGGFEKGTVFGRTLEEDLAYFFEAFGITPADLDGRTILDAGCGSGALTAELARRHPQTTVVGMDINPAIAEVYRQSLDLPNLHIVRGSVFEPPFPSGSFDYVWSNGVIHHTGDTRRAFDAVTDRVKRGGHAYLWVYEKKLSPMVALRMALTPLGLARWDHHFLYRCCQVISGPTWLAVKLLNVLGAVPPVQRRTHLRILTKRRTFPELVLTWFDVLSPRYRDTHTSAEVEAWFHDRGFTDLNRYWWPVGVSGVRR